MMRAEISISALYNMAMFERNLWALAKRQWFPLTATIAFGAILGGLVVAQAWFLSRVISDVFMDQKALGEVQPRLAWLLAIVLMRAGIVYAKELSASQVSIRIRSTLSVALVRHVLRLSPVQISLERAGEITNTVVQGIGKLDAYFRVYLPQLAFSVILPVMILAIAFPLDWLTGVIFLVTAPLIPLFMILIGKQAEKETSRQWKLLGRLSGHFYEVLSGLRILKAYGVSKRQGKVIRSVSEQYAAVTLKVLRIAFLSALVLEILATISTAVIAVQIGLRLLYGQITYFESLFILILAPEFYFPLRQLGAAFHSGMEGISAAERIFQLLQTETIQGAGEGVSLDERDLQGDIRFEGVSFAYQGGERPSLIDVSFTIPWGKKTVLVGPSGSGKSTILGLLMGFISPGEGQILVNHIPFDEISMGVWRQRISWIPQFPTLFHQSIAENLYISRPDATSIELNEAAEKANVHDFISSLPDGYETNIGERGVRISGGQGQRLAIARAFLRDSPLLLLDEPTTNLDIQNELLIKKILQELLRTRTVLMIAHRRESILSADHIVVLDKGRVVQMGAHEDLLKTQGLYRTLILEGAQE